MNKQASGKEFPADFLNSSDEKPLQAMSMTGLAATVSGDTVYQYFQNPEGNILENSYAHGAWTLDDNSDNSDALVSRAAAAGSPLAATSYSFNGENYRQVFYITSTGEITTINRTESRSWDTPIVITDDAAYSGSIALAACSNPVQGIQVFYG